MLVLGAATFAVLIYFGKSSTKSSPSPFAASQHPTPPKGVRASSEASPGSALSEASSPLLLPATRSRFLTDKDLQALALTPSEEIAFNDACDQALTGVRLEMAKAGRVDSLDHSSAQFSVHLGAQLAERLRADLYGNLKSIMGTAKFEAFLSLGRLTQFEAKFDFFGEFPTRYVFAGTSDDWSSSSIVELRAEIDRSEAGVHKFTSFTEGKLSKQEFEATYGAIAQRVLRSD